MDKLTDDLLVEILSRVPYRSLRRSACVSRRWRALIAHPDHRRRLPQTLAGFFHHRRFIDVPSGAGAGAGPPLVVDPSLAFLPDREREGGLHLLDCCNGLLLFRCFRFADPDEFEYLVINPAREKWVAVPVLRRYSYKVQMVRLGFEPAVSSQFHVFEFQLDWDEDEDEDEGDYEDEDDGKNGNVLGVKIYSSETGLWNYKQSGWRDDIRLDPDLISAFVDGILYVVAATDCVLGAVDVEGRTWRIIDFPRVEDLFSLSFFGAAHGLFIGLSQGQLHLACSPDLTYMRLAIWVLEDRNKGEWIPKHTVIIRNLVRMECVWFLAKFIVVSAHPYLNTVFFILFGHDKKLISYDLDSREACVIRSLGDNDCGERQYIPYVPLFSESSADGQH